MLSALDETLMHQGPVTFDHALTSDHRFFDRMFLGGHCAENVKFIVGLAAYKNMNAVDGFLCVQKDGRQHNLRVSRSFLPQLGEPVAGPLSVEVVEPLRTLRVALRAGTAYPHAADLTFTGLYPAYEEAHHLRRVAGRLQEDYRRFDQIGRVDGWIDLEGQRIPVTDWFGVRDHSWGVRAGVGGYEPATTLPTSGDPSAFGLLFVWLAFRTATMAGQLQRVENGAGDLLAQDGHVFKAAATPAVRVTQIEHAIDFIPGTRVFRTARLSVSLADGDALRIEARALLSPWCYKGAGYDSGFDDEMGLGLHRGERLESDAYDVSHPEDVRLPDDRVIQPWHREQPVTLTVNGEPGLGHLPIINVGVVRRYELTKPATNRRGG
jgi:hypothetical protein